MDPCFSSGTEWRRTWEVLKTFTCKVFCQSSHGISQSFAGDGIVPALATSKSIQSQSFLSSPNQLCSSRDDDRSSCFSLALGSCNFKASSSLMDLPQPATSCSWAKCSKRARPMPLVQPVITMRFAMEFWDGSINHSRTDPNLLVTKCHWNRAGVDQTI